jgi:hypothetical protein
MIMKVYVALLCALFSGCVGVAGLAGAHVKAYKGPERPDSEVAILLTSGDALLSKVDDQTYGDDFFRGFPQVTKVLPGRHRVTVKCLVDSRYAFPSFDAVFDADHHYELRCSEVQSGYAHAAATDLGADYVQK